ncbi:unnamed protein product [Ixodes persulcatus]
MASESTKLQHLKRLLAKTSTQVASEAKTPTVQNTESFRDDSWAPDNDRSSAPLSLVLPARRSGDGPDDSGGSPRRLEAAAASSVPSKLERLRDLLRQKEDAGTNEGKAAGLHDDTPLVRSHRFGPPQENVSTTERSFTTQDPQMARTSRHKRRKIRRGKLPAAGQRTLVVVVGADVREKTLYVQERSLLDELLAMMKDLNRALREDPQPLDNCDPGHFVAVLREEDSTWYRARVYDISKDSVHGAAQKGGSATVFYVDYGHWETMPLDGLRRLPDALLNDAAFAVPVVLHGVPALSSRAAAALQGKFVEAQVLVDERPQQIALFTTDDNVRLNDVISTFDH